MLALKPGIQQVEASMSRKIIYLLIFLGSIVGSSIWHFVIPFAEHTYYRASTALELGLPMTASSSEIFKAMVRKERAANVDLPSTATDAQIRAAEMHKAEDEKREDDRKRVAEAASVNLPATATWGEIWSEQDRRSSIKSMGLPADTTTTEIDAASELLGRSDQAGYIGLPSGASWTDIEAEKAKRRSTLIARLNLPAGATADDITNKLLELAPSE